ncbi:MAG: DUF4910 domain-containing protein [Magnetococcales bacterium]|nr:DUF4910 domain-containing protein [Magnetococcales bacterium]MBF0156159.1 DUF4910 domain-containing protein [Magnetococcales bacterium]
MSPQQKESLAQEAGTLFRRLFPICRSLTGPGVRQSLEILREVAFFHRHEIPSGTQVFDWIVPDEWRLKRARLWDDQGALLLDSDQNNLHVLNYSIPFDGVVGFAELDPHLHTLPHLPQAIPYRTSYYTRDWGFCLSHRQYEALDRAGRYRVQIETELAPGILDYGDCLTGAEEAPREYLFSTYICHPSLANDNLSGPILWVLLLRALQGRRLKNRYRFVIIPETIGAVAYLACHGHALGRVQGGYVLSCVAGPGILGYKQSLAAFRGAPVLVDRAAMTTLAELDLAHRIYPFDIHGSDERQYSLPAWRIPVGSLHASKYYEYDEYHTSLDNLDFVRPERLVDMLELYLMVVEKLERNATYRSLLPQSEAMLGKRGLYPATGGSLMQPAAAALADHGQRRFLVDAEKTLHGSRIDAMLWLMMLADGQMDLLAIAQQTGIAFSALADAADLLCCHGLLAVAQEES